MSLTFTMDDVREHCSPPTNGWLPGADSIKMADEIDRLRAQLAQVNGNYHACRDYLTDDFDRANTAEAAIARVRELCDVAHADCQEEFIPAMDGYVLFLKVDDVLRSLDGAE